MKRFHVHVAVADLDRSIAFYSGLFNAPPTVSKPDYAKWMVEDPRLNFAISTRGGTTGVDHLGLQADDETELAGIRAAFVAADASSVVDQPEASCCYARSNKHWLTDPQGIAWEGYQSLGHVEFHGGALRADQGAHAEPTHDVNHSGDTELALPERSLQPGDVKGRRGGACCGPTAGPASDTDLAHPERSLQPGDVKGGRGGACCGPTAAAASDTDLALPERSLQPGDVKGGRGGACCGPTAAAAVHAATAAVAGQPSSDGEANDRARQEHTLATPSPGRLPVEAVNAGCCDPARATDATAPAPSRCCGG